MQTNKVMTEAKLNEIARARLGFVFVMLAVSICSLMVDIFFI